MQWLTGNFARGQFFSLMVKYIFKTVKYDDDLDQDFDTDEDVDQ